MIGANKLEEEMTVEDIVKLDESNKLVERNFNSPIQKDTLTIQKNGVAVLRFRADNPGMEKKDPI